MIEAIAELDDELMAAWVSRPRAAGRADPTPRSAASRSPTRRADARRRRVRNQGIHNLLDAVLDYLPSPADCRGARPATRRSDERSDARSPDRDDEPLAALAFKVQIDERRRPAHVRPRLHRLPRASATRCSTRRKGHNEQIGRLVRMFANHREDIRADRGRHDRRDRRVGICDGSPTGDTLCDPRAPILLDAIAVPSAVIGRRRRARDRRGPREARRRARAARDRGPVVPRQAPIPTPARS